jgi:ribosomal protein S18 acetylase RimI-like enzyme
MTFREATFKSKLNGADDDAWVPLPWDTNHFGFPIGRLLPTTVPEDEMPDILRMVDDAGIRCLYWLSDPGASQVRLAHRSGFQMVDMRVELEIRLGPEPSAAFDRDAIRKAEEPDLEPLKILASRSHRNTRFYSDPGFPVERVDALYAAWIKRSFHDPSQELLVSGPVGMPDGYVAAGVSEEKHGSIGLVAVDEGRRGAGLGSYLVKASMAGLARRGATQVSVVTQGENERALRLYEKLGFSERSRLAWFHRWSDGPSLDL